MSLMRQVAWLVLGVTLAALVGAVGLSTLSMRELMQAQLQLKNADNAQALALALSQQGGDAELIKLLISAQFDTGAYEHLRWRAADGQLLFERVASAKPGAAPEWFRALAPIHAKDGVAQLSSGWQAIGAIELRSHSAYAFDALWLSSRRLLAWLLSVAAMAAVAAWWGLGRIRRPLDAAVAQAEAVMGGRYSQVLEPRVPELARLTRAMNGMVARVKALFDAQAGQLLVLRDQVHHDALTRVATRKHFMAELGSRLERDEGGLQAGLVLVRLRNLVELNARIGHAETDALLCALADALRLYPERVPGCLIGRLNGSDFALWLPAAGVTGETAQAVAEALRALLPAFDPQARAALGAVELARAQGASVWLGEADAALARAETQGRGVVEVVSVLSRSGAPQGEGQWRSRLQDALAQGRGRLVSFPMAGRNGRALHLECPLQLQLDADGDWWPAALWLPLAQRARLTAAIDALAVRLALAAIAQDGQARCIHIAPASLLDAGFLPQLREQISAAPRQSARSLLLDVGETVATTHFELLVELGRQLRPLGVRLGLEHAGAGLAQVEQLFQAGLDYVKLDAAVVRGVAGDPARVAFVRSLGLMLRSLALKIYGEGITDALDAQALWDCDLDGLTGPWVTAQTQPGP